MKANCYECRHRNNVMGDCHSSCSHPSAMAAIKNNPLAQALAIFGGMKAQEAPGPSIDLNIKADPHGVANGWFMWPVNYDPAWLQNCDGFEPIQGPKGAVD